MKRLTSREVVLPILFALIGTLALVLLTASCAELGLVKAETPEDKVAAGFASAEAVNRLVTARLNERKISSADAEQIREATRAAAKGLIVARGLLGTNPDAAALKAAAVRAGLEANRQYLESKGGK